MHTMGIACSIITDLPKPSYSFLRATVNFINSKMKWFFIQRLLAVQQFL